MTQCQPQPINNELPISMVVYTGRRNNRAFVAQLNSLLALPNLKFLCYYADWNPGTQSFDLVLTDFGQRLRLAITSLNPTLIHYLYQEALADQLAVLEAAQGFNHDRN